MRALRVLLAAALCAVLAAATPAYAAAAAPAPAVVEQSAGSDEPGPMPTRRQWGLDIREDLDGSLAALRDRVRERSRGERLAINLDIDNTALMTYYARGEATRPVLRLARYADRLGVDVLFNTGRKEGRRGTVRHLREVGFPVDAICLRRSGERVAAGKQRWRDRFAARGWTVVHNVGNRATDFRGDGYEQAWRLPDYDERLG